MTQMQAPAEKAAFHEVTLPDGTKAYVLSPEQMLVLAEMAEDKIWWKATQKRIKRVSLWGAGAIAFLSFLSAWWPWIRQFVELIIQDIPA